MRLSLCALMFLALLAAPARAAAPAAGPLVTPAWLAQHLDDPSVVVLQIATVRADYEREHVPGARFLWLSWVAASRPDGVFEMVSDPRLVTVFEGLGVSNKSRVVICSMLGDVAAAARVYVTLDHLGMGEQTSILDGGLEAWKADGRPVTKEEPRIRKGKLKPRVQAEAMVDAEQVRSRLQSPATQLLDARPPQAYNAAPSLTVFRGGHIPGALNLPFTTLTDSLGRYLPADTLRARFEAAGVEGGRKLIAYCNSGYTASPVFVAARLLGYPVALYDGSFVEWSRREDLPVENTGKKK